MYQRSVTGAYLTMSSVKIDARSSISLTAVFVVACLSDVASGTRRMFGGYILWKSKRGMIYYEDKCRHIPLVCYNNLHTISHAFRLTAQKTICNAVTRVRW